MEKLKALWRKDPGLFISVSLHALAFAGLIVNFAFPPKISDATEAVPVEMITTSELNQIMNGEETAKQMPKPQRRIDKVAELEEHHQTPPLNEAKKDTPTPPTPDKPTDDPGDADKPVPATAAASPPPPPPTPTPPERPVEKAEAPKPPPKPPEEVKPPPPDAEALDTKPPPRPKDLPKTEAKETKQAKAAPTPPVRPVEKQEKTEPKKDNLGDVAKLLAQMKPPKPPAKVRTGSATPDTPRKNDFNVDKISALLDKEAPQHRASTGQQLTQMASLGSANSHAEKMSPSMTAQLDGWLIDHYRGCWSYFGLGATQNYVPEVRVRMAQDGSLIGEPALLNPTNDPNLRSLADSAIRAVNRCNPMPVPDRFKPYYDAWRLRVVRFDPKEMS